MSHITNLIKEKNKILKSYIYHRHRRIHHLDYCYYSSSLKRNKSKINEVHLIKFLVLFGDGKGEEE